MHKHVGNNLPRMKIGRTRIVGRKNGIKELRIDEIGDEVDHHIQDDDVFGNGRQLSEHRRS